MIRFFICPNQKKSKKIVTWLAFYGNWCMLPGEDLKGKRMRKRKKSSVLPVIGLRANEDEQAMFNLIRKTYRIPSNSHVIRVLVTREYEKILAENTPVGVNIGE